MRKTHVSYLALVIFAAVIAGCKPGFSVEQNDAFSSLFPNLPMNEYMEMKLWKIDDLYDGSTKEVILVLNNISDQTIQFKIDMGIRLFTFSKEKEQWVEIENRVQYSGNPPHLEPKGQLLTSKIVSVVPALRASDLPATVLVVVVGEFISPDENSTNKVGAFYDVLLK